jgi:hypothetical protein
MTDERGFIIKYFRVCFYPCIPLNPRIPRPALKSMRHWSARSHFQDGRFSVQNINLLKKQEAERWLSRIIFVAIRGVFVLLFS